MIHRQLDPMQKFFALLLSLLGTSSAIAEITLTTDFPGGSAEVVSLEGTAIHIHPAVRPDRGWPCWWYARLDGLPVGEQISLTVSANPQTFRGTNVLDASWSLPDRAAVSSDNSSWQHTEPGARPDKKSAIYRFKTTAETMWVAWGPRFVPSDADELLLQAKTALPSAEVFTLAKTRDGRPVKAVRFGAAKTETVKPFGIWIQARQHAWEAGSSWVGRGFLLWATSNDPAAIELRNHAHITFVPIMDVDNVTIGAGGKESVPTDHNRSWTDNSIYPEVTAAQNAITSADKAGRFNLFIDLHNPGPSDRRPFFYGPKMDSLSVGQREKYEQFFAAARSSIDDLEPTYRFTTYIKTEEELNRVSSNWVRVHTADHVVATTLETSWNRPQGTQDGYELVGEQLGRAIAEYFRDR